MVQPSETPLSPNDITRIKKTAELKAIAFRLQIDQVIGRIDRLSALKFDPDIETGIPDSEELERLLKLGDAIAYCRSELLQQDDLLCTLLTQYSDYCVSLPEEDNLCSPFVDSCNEYSASTRTVQGGLKPKLANLQLLTDTCRENVRTLRKSRADAAEADSAPQFGDTEHGSSSSQKPATGGTPGPTDARHGGIPPPSSPFRTGGNRSSRTAPGDAASLMAHFRALGSSCSHSSPSRPRSPLRYTATGMPTSTGFSTADTGADFSRFGSNPFYVNSTVKLPIKSSVGTPTGKEPSPPPLTLNALPIKPFDGDERQYPRFQRFHIQVPDFLLKYGEGFTTMEADGTIGRFDGTTRNSALLHLLAHHAVLKESSATTKVRPVFDGSAKMAGKPSINDQLHRGPVLLPTMAAILVRVRLHQILLIADIAKAFHQVSLHPADRSACAFLWLKDPLQPPTDDNLIYYRFHRVPFGLKPSPFLLGATIQMHLETIGTPLAKEIWSNCYVDNVILGANSLDEALEKYHGSKACFSSAKMQLRQFASNCSEFNEQLPPDDAAELDNLSNLGYQWDVESDCFCISLAPKPFKGKAKGRRNIANSGEFSRRFMMQRIARIFDPVGYLQPVLLPAKLVVQEIWKLDAGWDDAAPPQLAAAWDVAVQNFEETSIVIPRRISEVPYDWLELHVYVDASKEAYGFATYIRTPADVDYNVSLVYSRAKVKPLKDAERMTIPRMELMAFLLGARNAHFMADTLEFQAVRRTIIWSDSMIVLQQLRAPEKSKEVFVENRLNEIRALQAEIRFETRYIHTSENPADLVSRGMPAHELQSCDLWWHASPFLRLDEALWPPQPSILSTAETPAQATSTEDATFPPPMGSFCGIPQELSAAELEASPWEETSSQVTADETIGGTDFHDRLLAWRESQLKREFTAAAVLPEPEDAADYPAHFTSPGFVSHFQASVRRTTPREKPDQHLVDIRTVGTTTRLLLRPSRSGRLLSD